MRIIRGLHNLSTKDFGSVLTIGNFDGVHLGHQALLKRAKQLAFSQNTHTMVMLFEPQPIEFFKIVSSPTRIYGLRDKLKALAAYEIDSVLILPFNEKFSQISSAAFIKDILAQQIQPKILVVGEDFQFGRRREGNVQTLKALAKNFEVDVLNFIFAENARVSSTLIRAYLQAGDIKKAERALGHPYVLSGRVVKGRGEGRALGFPTANVHLKFTPVLGYGIYAVWIENLSPQAWPGVAYFGTRPTFHGKKPQLEVHLLDFHQMIYDSGIQVEFVKKLRQDQYFDSRELLKKQIERDILAARALLKK